jgi:hypothetical protein
VIDRAAGVWAFYGTHLCPELVLFSELAIASLRTVASAGGCNCVGAIGISIGTTVVGAACIGGAVTAGSLRGRPLQYERPC